MSTEARLRAQAKINLFLRILAREAGGSHDIETLFLRLELGDDVTVRVGGATRAIDTLADGVSLDRLGAPTSNLAYRAAVAYADATGWPDHFSIEIVKRIPLGGGLGGGSADAGAVLRALDALAPQPVGPRRLLELATPLGADVPFLTSEAACALAWGRGERMLALAPPPARDVALCLPPFGVATADAYRRFSEARGEYRPHATLIDPRGLADWGALAAMAGNDFEPVVAPLHPALGVGLERLRAAGAELTRMTGSGSTLFGIFAQRSAIELPAGWRLAWTRSAAAVEAVARAGTHTG